MSEVVIGRNSLVEALRAGRGVERILLAEGTKSDARLAEIVRLARARGITVEHVSGRVLDRIGNRQVHQGVIAYAADRPRLSVGDLEAISRLKNEAAFYVILDGIEDPHNLGAVIRTAEATGVHAVITRSRRAVGLTPAALKAAAGAAEYMPLVQVVNIAQTMETLRKSGVWLVGIDATGEQDYTRVDYTPPTAVVIGAEGRGISPLVRKKCDLLASIPMKGKITSLNASVAAGVVLYEGMKQRTARLSQTAAC